MDSATLRATSAFLLDAVSRRVIPAVALSLCLAAQAAGTRTIDPVSQDPVVVDKVHPPRVHEVTFDSGGVSLYGKVFSAQGTKPHPTVLIARGFPDMTSSADIALVLQRAGYNAMIFNYRGAWGMGGTYSMENSYQDLKAAVAFLRSASSTRDMQVDPKRIVLYGYSFGGPIVLRLAAEDAAIRGVAHIDGSDLRWKIPPNERAEWEASLKTPAIPSTTGRDILDGIEAHLQDWDPAGYTDGLKGKDVLLVWSGLGEPPEKVGTPLRLLFAGKARLTIRQFKTDHDFADHRMRLARAVLAWMRGMPASAGASAD